MMAGVMTWWRRFSRREQLLLTLMLALLLAVGLWLGVLRPVATARAEIAARQAAAGATLADVTAMGLQIKAARAGASDRAQLPLLEHVRQSADAAGLTLEQLAAARDGSAVLRIAAIRSTALLRWLAELETREDIVVERLSATRNEDASLAVDITLRKRAT